MLLHLLSLVVVGLCALTIGAAETGAVARTVLSRERIDVGTTYPGARPFPGAEILAFRVEPPFSGDAVLTLSSGSVGTAAQGQKSTFSASTKNGILRFKCRLPFEKEYQYLGIDFKPTAETNESWKVCDGAGEFCQTVAEAMRVEVETGNCLGIVRKEIPAERPVLVVRNPTRDALRWKTVFRFADVFGRIVDLPFDRAVGPGEIVRLPIPWPLPAKGVWQMTADVTGDDGSRAKKETRFAFIDLHEVTPIVDKPKFRMGIHWHGALYMPDYIDPTIDAIVAAGAKFIRTDYGFMFGAVCPSEGEWKWDKADFLIERIRRAGLSADIIIGGTAKWAVDPRIYEERKGISRRLGCLPTRPGVYREFCREIAGRYGTKIDYYENGNEWDLTPYGLMTDEEAVRMQKEAYEGVHAGCPDACVIPNGWCSPATTPDLKNLKSFHPGLIESVAAHPEYYDAWAYHNHGLFHWYEGGLQNFFLPLRDQIPGFKARPWLANETAVTTYKNGEKEVARNVWQKILYAWAWGAQDYIWYNLRATGWFEGNEPGYGLMTADMKPRATYAAYAALAKIFQGLDADGRIYSRKNLHLMRFRGVKNGFKGLVLGGWDYLSEKPRVVRVRTDADSMEFSDYMGNRRAGGIKNGVAELTLSADPIAVLLHGATFAEAFDLADFVDMKKAPKLVGANGDEPDFTIDTADRMKDFNAANPALEHRVWSGPADLSAKIWLAQKGSDLVVKVDVEDDLAATGDGLCVYLEPVLGGPIKVIDLSSSRPHVEVNRSRIGSCWRYEAKIGPEVSGLDKEKMESGFGFSVRVMEDDGEGPDGWLELARGSEDLIRIRF